MSAEDRGWGSPCPSSSIVTIEAGGRRFSVHKRVAVIFKTFINELVSRGYVINKGTLDDWSYVCRHIGNDPSKPWSNHAWGLAVDINSLTNPMRRPLTTNMPAWVRNADYLMKKYGLRWGGAYVNSTPDPMHFEFMLTPADADRITAALQAQGDWLDMATAEELNDKLDAILDALAVTGSTGPEESIEKLYVNAKAARAEAADAKAAVGQVLVEMTALQAKVDEPRAGAGSGGVGASPGDIAEELSRRLAT